MKKLLYIITLCLVVLSCKRRELTYDYNPKVAIAINADWSNMSQIPTGMSIYCYPEDGGAPTVASANINSVTSNSIVELTAGKYNILVFNQIPSDFSTIAFNGMECYETAEIKAVSTKSNWATSKVDGALIHNPEELAAATYLDLEVTQEAVNESISQTDKVIYKSIDVTPEVVTKETRVKVRVSGSHNFRSARATIYGMASGYNFSQRKSHTEMSTHLMESWSLVNLATQGEGEVVATFSCFGLPEQSETSVASDYDDWAGELNLDILLIDNKTIINNIVSLGGKVTSTESTVARADTAVNTAIDVDIKIGYGLTADDIPYKLPDVVLEGGSPSGFDAVVGGWGDEVIVDTPL